MNKQPYDTEQTLPHAVLHLLQHFSINPLECFVEMLEGRRNLSKTKERGVKFTSIYKIVST